MPQESLIPALDDLLVVERVAPGEDALVKALLRLALPWVPPEVPLPVVLVTAIEHDAIGGLTAEVLLFDGGRAGLWLPPPLAPGAPQRVRLLDGERQVPIGYDRARRVWRRYPDLALLTGDAREALARLDVDDAEYLHKAEKRREAARRAAETRRRNRLAREAAEGGAGGRGGA